MKIVKSAHIMKAFSEDMQIWTCLLGFKYILYSTEWKWILTTMIVPVLIKHKPITVLKLTEVNTWTHSQSWTSRKPIQL
jgi:hypothetical protein